MHYTKTKLENAIKAVNKAFELGKNDDDHVFKMRQIDKKTKGFSFVADWDSYRICTDFEKLEIAANEYGYWSKEVQVFNEVLKEKGGYPYMEELNNKYKEVAAS